MSTDFASNLVSFGSDNHSGIHPEIFQALNSANVGHAPSYGTCTWTLNAQEILAQHFGKSAEYHFVFNGTAANVLALATCVQSHQSVLCSDVSHINLDECGAPERWLGCKLVTVKTSNGKLNPDDLKKHVIRRGDQHFSQIKAISITQPTELGTVYSLQELKNLREFADQHKLLLHIDGARFTNALVSLGLNAEAFCKYVRPDVISLGGTKNGLAFGECVVIMNPELAADFKFKRKQAMQLPSKTRFIAAQFSTWLGTNLWSRIATHSLKMASTLRHELDQLGPQVKVTHETQSNAVFVQLPRHVIKPLREKYFFYIWDETTFEARLMCTFDTKPEHIEGFVSLLKRLLQKEA